MYDILILLIICQGKKGRFSLGRDIFVNTLNSYVKRSKNIFLFIYLRISKDWNFLGSEF